jgi:hypothetical protein
MYLTHVVKTLFLEALFSGDRGRRLRKAFVGNYILYGSSGNLVAKGFQA